MTLPAGTTALRLIKNDTTGGPNLDKIELVLTSPSLTSVEIDHAAVVENAEGAVVGNLSVNGGQDSGRKLFDRSSGLRGFGESAQAQGRRQPRLRGQPDRDGDGDGDQRRRSTASTFTIAVGNDAGDDAVVDQPASIALTAIPVDENAAGAVVAEIVITDPDTSYDLDDVTLSGPDADLFRVIAGGATGLQLALKPGEALDFEAAEQPSVTVHAGGADSGAFTPEVQDVDDTSTPDTDADEGDDLALAPVTAEVDGETGLGAVQFRLTGVDADITGFEVSVNAGESFVPATATADGPGAFLLTIDLSSYDGAPEGIANVRVTDAAGNTAIAEGTVAITYPEAPGFPLEIQAESFTIFDTTADHAGARCGPPVRPACAGARRER